MAMPSQDALRTRGHGSILKTARHLTNCPVLPAAIEAAPMGGKGGSMSRRAHRNKAHGTRAGLSNGPSIGGKRELTHRLRPLFSRSLQI
jgi:hypothetical protein